VIRVGLVGFGLAGKVFHAPLISATEGLELAAVVERNSHNAAAAYPGVTTYRSLTGMLVDESLELIVVATPPATHVALATDALQAHRHVVVDKPVAPSSDEIAGLIQVAASVDRFFIPFHNRRWDSDFQTLQKVLHEKTLDRIVSLESTFDRWKPAIRPQFWKEDGTAGGGHLLDIGTHVADQAIHLFGLPEGVSAQIRTERENAVTDDSFTIHLRYADKLVTLSSNCLATLPRPRFLLRGTQGNFMKWGLDPQEARLKDNPHSDPAGWGIEPESDWGDLSAFAGETPIVGKVPSVPGAYLQYYEGVRDAILQTAPPPVAGIDALHVARLLELARKSSEQRREIALSEA
jgi:predicted dehydrogenase